jgi:hypothetical protein
MKFLWRAKTTWLWYELEKGGMFPANTPVEDLPVRGGGVLAAAIGMEFIRELTTRCTHQTPSPAVNGGVKAGQRGGAKPGRFAAWA